MVVNTEIVMLAALKNVIERCEAPTANMWCTQTPMPTTPVSTVDTAIQE